jgi:hypothetical protein
MARIDLSARFRNSGDKVVPLNRGGSFPVPGDFKPSRRHLQKDCPFTFGLCRFGPAEMLVRVVIEFVRRCHLIAPSAASRTTAAFRFGTFGKAQHRCCAYRNHIR